MVIADRFSGMDQVDRQRLVWTTLRHVLAPEQLLHVGLLMTLTPAEAGVAREC
jgi:acid stress-induced BolA-like protein IbaG/YrbA